ncbi:MAG: hypothetical protein RMK29_19985 [Myxococcales bacterium]|nr:hypothetical protein [Myxococcota bacterium]MDW8283990.1 hypothetical protein [Myxococcales bacterium]
MPKEKTSGGVVTIQQQLTEAASAFAREILNILRATTLSDLTALAGRAASGSQAADPAASQEQLRRRRPSARTSTLRRIAGTKPVSCPVPGCQNPGVRSKMNFCNDHAASLPKAERIRLRQQQRSHHVVESIQLPEDDRGEGKKKAKKRS